MDKEVGYAVIPNEKKACTLNPVFFLRIIKPFKKSLLPQQVCVSSVKN